MAIILYPRPQWADDDDNVDSFRAQDKARIFIPKMPISLLNPMFDPLLESSHRDDSNKRSSIGFGQEIMELAPIEVYFTHVIWSSAHCNRVVSAYEFLFHVHLQPVCTESVMGLCLIPILFNLGKLDC